MAKSSSPGTALAAYAPAGNLPAIFAEMGKVRFVQKDELLGGNPITEEQMLETLRSDGYTNAEAALQALNNVFGMTRYADKAELIGLVLDPETGAVTGKKDPIPFRILEVVMVEGGGFRKDDCWACRIVTDEGEPMMLTFERNDGRDKYLFARSAILHRFPDDPGELVTLDRVYKADDTAFDLIVPVRAVKRDRHEAIDASFRETTAT